MDPSEFYKSLIASITEEDTQAVARIMANHIGASNLISLQDLTVQTFGEYTTSTERKTREILEDLTVNYHMAVCSVSGKPGRWLASSEDEREAAARELEARGRNTLERARALRMAVVPGKEPTFQKTRQPSLWR